MTPEDFQKMQSMATDLGVPRVEEGPPIEASASAGVVGIMSTETQELIGTAIALELGADEFPPLRVIITHRNALLLIGQLSAALSYEPGEPLDG